MPSIGIGIIIGNEAFIGGGVSPPAKPTGLVATAGDNTVSLSVTAVSGATSYTWLRSDDGGTTYNPLTTNSSPSYVDNTAVNGTTYFYEVVANNGAGSSPASDPVSATPSIAILSATPDGNTGSGFAVNDAITFTSGSTIIRDAAAHVSAVRDIPGTPATGTINVTYIGSIGTIHFVGRNDPSGNFDFLITLVSGGGTSIGMQIDITDVSPFGSVAEAVAAWINSQGLIATFDNSTGIVSITTVLSNSNQSLTMTDGGTGATLSPPSVGTDAVNGVPTAIAVTDGGAYTANDVSCSNLANVTVTLN